MVKTKTWEVNEMRVCFAMFFLLLVPMSSHSMQKKLPDGLTIKEFNKQKSNLQRLGKTKEKRVKRQVEKIFQKLYLDIHGNTKYLAKQIAFHYQVHNKNPELALETITSEIRKLIGEKFSNLPDDPYSSIGTLLWLKKKRRSLPLKNCLETYLSNPHVFGEKAAAIFYRKADTKIFL